MSDTVSETDQASAAADELPARPARTKLQSRIRQMLLGIFVLDAGVLFITSVIAWWYQGVLDRHWLEVPWDYHWLPLMGPGMIALWRPLAAGSPKRTVLIAFCASGALMAVLRWKSMPPKGSGRLPS